MTTPLNTASLVSAATAKEQVLGRLEHYAKSRNSLGYYGPGDSFIDQGVVVALTQLLAALESTSRALSEKEVELAERSKEVLAAQGQADDNYQRYIEATRQRDEALAALKASEERETAAIEAGRDLLSYLALYDFNDRDPGEELPEYMARLTAALFARSALENGPANLADATQKDLETEQREAGV